MVLSLCERQGQVGLRNFAARALEGAFLHLWKLQKEIVFDPEQLEKNVLEFLSHPKEKDASSVG